MSALPRALANIVGASHVLVGDAARPYETDTTADRGLRGIPDAVALPATAEELASVVAWCYARGVPMTPRGGGSGFAGGAVPVSGGVVIGTERLTAVRELSAEEWRMTVEAGVTTANVHRLALENGLLFPPDPGAAEQSHIGGNVATNAGGPHAFKYGATGAWVNGIEAVLADGEPAMFGGALRKDVGGYDLKSLLVGSEGTLGVITAVTLRLLPAPEATFPVVAFYADARAGTEAIGAVLGNGLQPAALDYLDGTTLGFVARCVPGRDPGGRRVRADGRGRRRRRRGAAPARRADRRPGRRRPAVAEPRPADVWRWRDGVSGAVATARGGKASEDIVVPWSRLDEAIAAIGAIGAAHGLEACSWGHAGDGNIHASFLIDPRSRDELAIATTATRRALRPRRRARRRHHRRARRRLRQGRPARAPVEPGRHPRPRGDQGRAGPQGPDEPGQEGRAGLNFAGRPGPLNMPPGSGGRRLASVDVPHEHRRTAPAGDHDNRRLGRRCGPHCGAYGGRHLGHRRPRGSIFTSCI